MSSYIPFPAVQPKPDPYPGGKVDVLFDGEGVRVTIDNNTVQIDTIAPTRRLSWAHARGLAEAIIRGMTK